MSEITNKVTELLKNYPSMKRRIEQLRFEMENPAVMDDKEFIESLALGAHTEGQGRRGGGHLSDKTMAIALQYKNIKEDMEIEMFSAIRRELNMLEVELSRLERYVSLLDKPKADVIRLLYFERKSWD